MKPFRAWLWVDTRSGVPIRNGYFGMPELYQYELPSRSWDPHTRMIRVEIKEVAPRKVKRRDR